MSEYKQGYTDYVNNKEGNPNPSAEYVRGWFDGMDHTAGFEDCYSE